ncbi:MAG: type II toxin-antitoxin system RelE/ParE family toxin [Oscillospiraceae bacterium]|nr:type II toxin-antitoxin system RelE/ParE family toxin [Oscillospiraceae bacterium]
MEHDKKVYKVIVDPSVNDRISDHFEFLSRVSVSAANRLLDELLKDIQSLETSPYRNPVYARPYLQQGKYRYKISEKRYRIVYQIDGDFVFVDDVQDCRQDDDKSILNISKIE